jgi:hypothetical protein
VHPPFLSKGQYSEQALEMCITLKGSQSSVVACSVDLGTFSLTFVPCDCRCKQIRNTATNNPNPEAKSRLARQIIHHQNLQSPDWRFEASSLLRQSRKRKRTGESAPTNMTDESSIDIPPVVDPKFDLMFSEILDRWREGNMSKDDYRYLQTIFIKSQE